MSEHNPPMNHFFVDNKKFDTERTSLKGLEIKEMAAVPANYQLFLEAHGTEEDELISDAQDVNLQHQPKHFFSVPPATFGQR
jgi:hypothetical protein